MHRITTINCGGKIIDLSSPIVMAIINNTPDSFFSGSRSGTENIIAERVSKALNEGAAIIDVGGYSSRPGADEVSTDEETRRVMMVLEVIRRDFGDIPVSADTFRAEVVERVVERFGAVIVNDISASIYPTAARLGLPYIAMHMQGTPKTMASETNYNNLIEDILRFFADKIAECRALGLKDIIVDPGFGFGKTLEQNFELLSRLNCLDVLGLPILAGISRKSMVYKPLNTTPDKALNGTSALHWEALGQGAKILRAHDTLEAQEVIRLFSLVHPDTE